MLLCSICEELCIKHVTKMSLKGLCHQDIAVLGQLVVTNCFSPNIKCSYRVMKKILNKFPKGALKNDICVGALQLACTTGEIKLWLCPSARQDRNPCFEPPSVYQDLSTRCDWLFKKPLSICQSGWRKIRNPLQFGNSLSPLRTQNKDLGAALQTLLTEVKLRLWRRPLYNLPEYSLK